MYIHAAVGEFTRHFHCHSFIQRPIHPLFGWVKGVVDGEKYEWTGKKLRRKKVFQNIDIVSYTLEVSVNGGHTCVCSIF